MSAATKAMKTHSPLPWAVAAEVFHQVDLVDVVSVDGSTVCEFNADDHLTEVSLANAEFIVRACNAHDELLAALKLYVEHFGDPLKVARPAIAKAEEVA